MTGLIIGGYILVVGHVSGSVTIIPTRYDTKEHCVEAAAEAAKGLPASFQWRCLKAGEQASEE